MDLRYGREATVGTLVILAILIFIGGTMWLSGRSVGNARILTIQFTDVSGLKRASPVRVSGVIVGKVEKITIVKVGRVLVRTSLDREIVPKLDASAQIQAITLVGDYAVDLNPGESSQPLPPDRVIVGTEKAGLSDKAVGLADKADTLLVGANAIINQRTADQLHATMEALQGTLAATQKVMRVYGDPERGPTAELTKTMASFRSLSARLDSTLASPGLQRALGGSDSLVRNLSAMTQQLAATGGRLDSLLAGVQRGEGTMGKIARDSTLYWNIAHLTASMDSLVNQIRRNPGKIQLNVPVKVF
jgi:phospholipid/cholesterol/gamma-HCH transport system substrate-binding protein